MYQVYAILFLVCTCVLLLSMFLFSSAVKVFLYELPSRRELRFRFFVSVLVGALSGFLTILGIALSIVGVLFFTYLGMCLVSLFFSSAAAGIYVYEYLRYPK